MVLHASSRISLSHNACISNHPYQQLVTIKVNLVYSYLPSIVFFCSVSGVSGHMDPELPAVLLWLTVISPADTLPLFSVQ